MCWSQGASRSEETGAAARVRRVRRGQEEIVYRFALDRVRL